MAMPPERSSSRTLHNFSLPTELKWGTQKHLRCIKLPVTASTTSTDGMQQLRHKLMLEYKRAVSTMADQILNSNDDHHPPPQQPTAKDDEKNVKVDEKNDLASSRPWNLRTRRSPAPAPEVAIPTKGKRRLEREREREEEKYKDKERVKVSVGLKKEEIDRDYLEMIGVKPPRRPKKRLRAVQKQLDTLFPGLWLTEVTPDMYEVVEHQE